MSIELLTEYHSNGQKKSEGNLKDGIREGSTTKWYENGQIKSEGNYSKDGEKDSKWTYWYENGQKKAEVNLKNGDDDGEWSYWYENGLKESEGNYADGTQVGKWTSWDWAENFISIEYYENGDLVKQTSGFIFEPWDILEKEWYTKIDGQWVHKT
jgi:antitoxin component YwqK of YwqJK toxin-antitoxin module